MKKTKFKVRDTLNNKWVNPELINLQPDGSLVWMTGKPVLDPTGIRYEIVFYTGLRDITDKAIFDGDILRCLLDIPIHKQSQRIGRVEYDDTWGMWMVSFDNYGEAHSFIGIADKFGPSECEIIGNIYENPELVK